MNRLRINWLLLPFSGLYGVIIAIRNWLFHNHLLTSTRPAVYTISVGNLTVGGTGKTPMVEFLIKRYALGGAVVNGGEVATLSRGYGRKTTGFRIVNDVDTANTVGDEPLQLYRKFSPSVRVCVGERRVAAIKVFLELYPKTKPILLDDAYQHRAVRPHLNLLLTDYNRPFYDDFPFPAGRLREFRSGAQRADAVVVTKCPLDLSMGDQQRMAHQILPYTRLQTPIFFAGLQYDKPVSFATRQPVSDLQSVVLVSGLANADPLEDYVRQTFHLHGHKRFADHYAYTRADLTNLMAELPMGAGLLTTEKDWVKLDALLTPTERATWPLHYLPIAVQFLPGQEVIFEQFLTEHDISNSIKIVK